MARPAIHGMTDTPTFKTWLGMIIRCYQPTAGNYARYGGSGISVCQRWRYSFTNFLEDMGKRPDGKSIDRIDNTKGYFPSNCRWSTAKEQVINRRSTVMLSFNGDTMCKTDWARKLGITPFALNERLRKWPVERALTQSRGPTGPKRK